MDISVSEISDRLAQQADRVCRMLLPGGRDIKGEWTCGDVSGGPGDSLKVHTSGEHAGKWRDWADSGQHGDLLDLWRVVKGVPAGEAIKQAKAWLGIEDDAYVAAPRKYSQPSSNGTKALSATGEAMKFLTQARKLDPAIVNRFKVEGVPDKRAIVFPCFGPDNRLVNRSYRTLPRDGEKKQVWQDKGCAPCLFGWHALDDSAYSTRTITLCEGQIDCMTWTQWGVPALSIPNGSGQTWIDFEWDNLAAFDRINISFDMDGAGAENAEKTIQRLGKHRCFIVELPHKDANDCLLAGAGKDDAAQWIAAAKAPEIKGLILARDLEKRLLRSMAAQDRPVFTLPFFQVADGEGFFMRPGEVTVWTGITSSGKSTFLNFLMLSAVITDRPTMIASMEVKAEAVLKRMMSGFLNREPAPEDVTDFLAQVGHQIVFADVIGYIGQEQLFDMMRFAQRRYGVEHALIDSLMRIEGLEEEYGAQGEFMNRLQEFAKTSGVHVHLVAHPRKMPEDGKPQKQDVKGSSLIPNNADNICAIVRNYAKEKLRKDGELTPFQAATMFDTEIRVEKQRETGWEGRFLLKFHPATYTFSAHAAK